MPETPLISVVMPAYNAAGTLGRAIESVRRQDYAPLEIIVADDGSSDATRKIASDAGTRLLAADGNRGAAAARNAGILAANGTYVAFLDADDAWRPGKLSAQVAVMERNPHVTLVTCDSIFLDPSGNLLKRSHERHPPASGAEAWRSLMAENFVPTPTVLARRRELLRLGGFDTRLPVGEDLDLWIRLALRGEVAVVPEVLVEIYDRPGSLMKQYATSGHKIVWPMIARHVRQQSHRMTRQQARGLMGQKFFSLAANCFADGAYLSSAALFARSAFLRFRAFKSLLNVPRALLLWAAKGSL